MKLYSTASGRKIITKQRVTRIACMALCLVVVFSAACSTKGKDSESRTVSADTIYFSAQKLDYYAEQEGEACRVLSAVPLSGQTAVLAAVSAGGIDSGIADKYLILIFDNTGKETGQIDLSAAFNSADSALLLTCDMNGNPAVLVSRYDEAAYEFSYLLHSFDTKGEETGEPVLLSLESSSSPEKLAIDKEGNIFVLYSGMQGVEITVLDSAGQPLSDISAGSGNRLAGNMFAYAGVVYADAYEQGNDGYKYVLYPMDTASGKTGDPIDISACVVPGMPAFYAGTGGLYYYDSTGVYSLDLQTKLTTTLLIWKDSDYAGTANEEKIIVLSADKIMAASTPYTEDAAHTEISLLSHEDTNPNVGKEIITIGGVGISYNATVVSAVCNFNRTNKEYRVEIRDYIAEQSVTDEDYFGKLISAMNLDILSGDCPDIIFGGYDSFANYEAKGLLVDLYTLMETDSTFNKDDYIPSLFSVCESDGHLYKWGTSFTIMGYAGAQSVIGSRTGWTVDEFIEMAGQLPEGMSPVYGQTKKDLLRSSLQASTDAFINYKTGEVSFDSNEFLKLLEYAKTYGITDEMQEQIQAGVGVSDSTKMKNGEVAVMSAGISAPSNYFYLVYLAGEPVSVIGYPSSDRRGPVCNISTMLAISSKSYSQKACWEFVKSLFTEDAQTASAGMAGGSIPVLKSTFEDQIEKAMNPDKNAGSGGSVGLSGVVSGMIVSGGYTSVPMTQEAADAYRDMAYGLDTLASYDQAILTLVEEEVPPYFTGQKSVPEVAALIQNRVQTLVDER